MPGRNRRPKNVETVMRALSRAITGLELPAIEKISTSQQEDPFQVLIATLLSARTQDATTLAASTRLFAVAPTPEAMVKLSVAQIEKLIGREVPKAVIPESLGPAPEYAPRDRKREGGHRPGKGNFRRHGKPSHAGRNKRPGGGSQQAQ